MPWHDEPSNRILQDLKSALLDERDFLPQAVINKLMNSMRDRCRIGIAAHGNLFLKIMSTSYFSKISVPRRGIMPYPGNDGLIYNFFGYHI